ncbi:MAG: hypothetical protein HQK55_03910 [Deltaproteobacteria bacterium]|nr:hypothetical protein [Deltaproteobacteria bacterium]
MIKNLFRISLTLMMCLTLGCGMDRGLGLSTRPLMTIRVDDAEAEIIASAEGWHTAAHAAPEYRWVPSANRWYLATSLMVRKNGAAGESARGWEVAYMLNQAVVHTTIGKQVGNCQEALAAALPFNQWLAMEARDPGIIRYAYESGRERDALRAILRSGMHANLYVPIGRAIPGQPQKQINYGPFFETVQQAVALGAQGKPDLESALYTILAPDPRFDTQIWDSSNVREFLLLAPDPQRKQPLIEQTLSYCTRTDLPYPCAQWRLDMMAGLIGESRDSKLCDRGLKFAAKLLDQPGEKNETESIKNQAFYRGRG